MKVHEDDFAGDLLEQRVDGAKGVFSGVFMKTLPCRLRTA